MIIKVCGMREAKNIRDLDNLNLIDMMGFIFYPKSKRFVLQKPDYLPVNCKRVGVFVNSSTEEILDKIDDFHLDFIQLHGTELVEQCKEIINNHPIQLIKAFSIDETIDFNKVQSYEEVCDYFLFDTTSKEYGGSGKTFNWELLHNYKGKTSFILSGGIKPNSLTELKRFHHSHWAGIDLNSGFEIAPAQKDISTLSSFISVFKYNN